MTFEAFCCEVDVAYRREYDIFPLDDEMPNRLPKMHSQGWENHDHLS